MSFALPTTTAGTPPVSVSCTPASGSAFPLGTTTVTCTATDASSRTAVCGFDVVAKGIQLSAKKFSAVGDSLTLGENGLPQGLITPQFADTPNSYPVKLLGLLNTAYPGQGMTVFSHGFGGDTTATTLGRLAPFLSADQPDAVLVLSGYNDLVVCSVGYTDNATCDAAIDNVESGLRDIIRMAKAFPGVRYVFVSTLTPGRPGSKQRDGARIVDANAHIKGVVAAEGAILVDTYPVFLGHEADYVSTDGLHLLPPGYQAMAQSFFDKIVATVPQITPQSFGLRRR